MKNSNHASKALAVVLSGALAFAPAANAALDESNMAYTSAAEGFYGSLRVQYANNESGGKNNDSEVEAEGSRLGVRGDIDLGGGLGAFYGFEWNLGGPANGDRADAANGTGLNTRQHHVGLKGDWGSIWLGAFDSVIVRFGGFSTTDILDQYSGNFEPIYRASNAVAYVSPDLNGFNFGLEVAAQDGTKKISGDADDGNDFDKIGIGASYSIQGLTFSGAYYQEQDALVFGRDDGLDLQLTSDEQDDLDATPDDGKAAKLAAFKTAKEDAFFRNDGSRVRNLIANTPGGSATKADDKGQYALGISYGQDNWIVAAMYGGEDVTAVKCDGANLDDDGVESTPGNQCDKVQSQSGDATFFSLAAGVSIDKLDFHGLWEQKTYEDSHQVDLDLDTDAGFRTFDRETTIGAITARYHLGSKARLRAGWKNTETDAGGVPTTDDTQYAIGMRVDF